MTLSSLLSLFRTATIGFVVWIAGTAFAYKLLVYLHPPVNSEGQRVMPVSQVLFGMLAGVLAGVLAMVADRALQRRSRAR